MSLKFSTHCQKENTMLEFLGCLVFFALAFPSWSGASATSNYLIGLGSYDVTGPAADVNMMGYADPSQNAAGIHLRLRARAFIVAETATTGKRVVFVNVDSCMGSQAVTLKVLSQLNARFGDLYTEKNVVISGIHTHSGPGGYLQYVLYLVTSRGFVKQSFNALVDGIVNSIVQAHGNLRPGSIFIKEGELLGANINRSPSAYLNNPATERKQYNYNVDKNMVLLKFVDNERGPIGAFNWFPVHCTSMNRTNTLISGDNKGAASRFMEDLFEEKGPSFKADEQRTRSIVETGADRSVGNVTSRIMRRLSGNSSPPFIAAFAQTNEGDVSPNTLGAFCGNSALSCDFNHSTCGGRNEDCIGRGPGYPDHFTSTKMVAEKQVQKAVELFKSAKEQLSGRIDYRQAFVDFSQLNVTLSSGQVVRTCPAAVGFSFAAGTTDGPGAFDFTQGDTKGNAFWKLVRAALKTPSKEQVECQKPKPILIDTGEMDTPYPWAPSILPIHILQVGQLIILSVPAEFSTMSGRRLRNAVKATLIANGNGKYGQNTHIVIAGLSNDYSQYVTTFEEYEIQRYEGASTLFGPHTLSGYIQEFQKLATALASNKAVASGPSPPDLLDKQIELLPGVVVDATPIGVSFGDVKQDVPKNAKYKVGDVVEVVFWSACPRNDLFTEKTFSLVELLGSGSSWVPVYDDNDWSVRFLWDRPFSLSPRSYATIRWEIPEDAKQGTYRISHFGASKSLLGGIKHFAGVSSSFQVV